MKKILSIMGIATAFLLTAIMALLPENAGATAYPAGTLVACPRSYRVDYVAGDGRRYVFANAAVYYTWLRDFTNLRNITCAEFDAIPYSGLSITARPGQRLIQFNDSQIVYAVARGGILRKLETPDVARAVYGAEWGRYIIIQPYQARPNYTMGAPITVASDYNYRNEMNAATTIEQELQLRGVLLNTTPPPTATSTPPTATTTPSCTADTWICASWNVCRSNSTQTCASYRKTFECPSVNTPQPNLAQSCLYTPPCTADTWACGNWASCQANNTQSRACSRTYDCPTATTPSPATSQSCVYVPPCTADTWVCTAWNACQANSTQTCAAYSKTVECPSVVTPQPTLNQICVYVPPQTGGGTGSATLSSIVSEASFNAMFPNRSNPACNGSLFTYSAFIQAAQSYPLFAGEGSDDVRKREAAAFLAQISHETTGGWPTAPGGPSAWGLCFKEEVGCERGGCAAYCDPNSQYQCVPGKTYHGRGPMQLSWNYNYGAAGAALGLNLLQNPNLVSTDGVVSFKTALWFWMTAQPPKPSAHDVMAGNWQPTQADRNLGRLPGFGMTTNIINGGLECQQPTNDKVRDRVRFFQAYTERFGVTTGENLYCDQMRHY